MSENQPKDEASAYPDVIIQGHDYDGIQEYDNPMPGWWLWIFYATIAWSIFYVAALGLGFIDDYDAQLRSGQQYVAELRQSGTETVVVEVTDDYLDELLADADVISGAERTYNSRCATCHGRDGEGGIGPALSADLRDFERPMMGNYEIIRDGLEGGMPAHDALMSTPDMAAVTVYIETL